MQATLTLEADAPMSAALQEELADWQALSAEAWAPFPYDEVEAVEQTTPGVQGEKQCTN